jgi:hypothetical protein
MLRGWTPNTSSVTDLIVSLANDWFEMVAADVVEPDSVVVEVVEHGQTKLVSFTVVRLRKAISKTIINVRFVLFGIS